MRGLKKRFIKSLTDEQGLLHPVLDFVKDDVTLCLQIRENYINVYYRGGNLLKLEEQSDSFKATFDTNYCLNQEEIRLPSARIVTPSDVKNWLEILPQLKREMDLWFTQHPKNEREFQQLLVRENNRGNCAKSTDYFICDIEYAYNDENLKSRFDIVAVCWPSSGPSRKNTKDIGLTFIEMKYADSALAGGSGLVAHLEDMDEFLSVDKHVADIKKEMRGVFNQLLELGLLDNQKKIDELNNDKPEYIFILANHDPEKTRLRKELEQINSSMYPHLDLKFAVSNFMGYGLYKECVFPISDFLEKFTSQI